ncbi:MAG: N-acetylmuramoyl-L-alanine amidase [Acutalibacteraceae bacterium]
MKQMFIPKGKKARPARPLKFSGVTIHNTGNYSNGAGALNHGKYMQGNGANNLVSWHYTVDDTNIVQHLPENEIAWHAGDGANGKGNTTTIAIEICVNPDSNLLIATDRAVKLTADILNRHGIKNANGYVFQHNNWNGKNCPAELRKGNPYNWQTFIDKVNAELQPKSQTEPNKYTVQKGDTLSGIAKKHNILLSFLLLANPQISNPNLIRVGQVITIPDSKGTVTEPVTKPQGIAVGSKVKVKQGAKTYDGKNIAKFVYNGTYIVDELKGNRAVLDRKGICTPVNISDLVVVF